MTDKMPENGNTNAEEEANKTIANLKEWAQWIIITVLFIVIGWPLLVEFFGV